MVRAAAGTALVGGLITLGAVLAVGPSSKPPSPVVGRSDATPSPLVEPAELREIYDESMRQLRDCIDDRRRDPATAGVFAC